MPVRHDTDPPVHPYPFPPPPERRCDAGGGPSDEDLQLSATLPEVIATRRNRAVERATELAAQLEEGDSRSLSAQTAIEEALRDVRHYSSLAVDLREVADDTAVYTAGNGRSVVADLRAQAQGDRGARVRLDASRRAIAAEGGPERRDLDESTTVATVPDWLIAESRPSAIKRAPLLTIAAKPLRRSGLQLRLPTFDTEPAAGPQNGLNAALPTATFADDDMEAPVRTFGCQVDIALQMIDQSPLAVDRHVLPALTAAVDAAIEESLWTGDGTGGHVTGIIETTGINTESYTSTAPTLVGAIPAIETLVREVETAGGWGGSPVLTMHPRRLSWCRQASAVEGVSLDWSPPPFDGATCGWFGGNVAVIADSAIPTTLGTGTSEDVIAAMRSLDVLDLYVSAPRVRVNEGVSVSNQLTATITVSRMVAMSAERLAGAVGILSGAGLAAP